MRLIQYRSAGGEKKPLLPPPVLPTLLFASGSMLGYFVHGVPRLRPLRMMVADRVTPLRDELPGNCGTKR
jgi:hypothetical protein